MHKKTVSFSFILSFSYQLILVLVSVGCTTAATKHSVNEKLEAQWAKYDSARAELIRRIEDSELSLEQKPMNRDEWERQIALPQEFAFLPDDLTILKRAQAERIETARKLAVQNSNIDLDKVRTQNQISRFCAEIPKGGMLHVHPTGTLNRKSIRRLLVNQNPKIYPQHFIEELESSGSYLTEEEKKWLHTFSENQRFNQLTSKEQERDEARDRSKE